MKKYPVILIALFFGFNLLAATVASGQSDCVSKCLPQTDESGHRHASGAAARLMHLNCCASNTAFPCELGSHRRVLRPDECSLVTCRTKAPNSSHTSLISRLVVAEGLTSSGIGLMPPTNVTGKAPPIYLHNLSILC